MTSNPKLDFQGIHAKFSLASVTGTIDYPDFRNLFKFTGFDPEVIANEFNRLGDTTALADLAALIVIGTERGNNIHKMQRSMSEEGKQKLQGLINKYHLVPSVGNNKAKAMTLSRIALCFPWVSCAYAAISESPVVPLSVMKQYVDNYPGFMLHPSFASCVPTDLDQVTTDTIFSAFALCQVRFAEIINRSAKRGLKKPSDYHEQVTSFARVSFHKAYIPNDIRDQLMKLWKIYDENRMVSAAVIVAADRYSRDRGDGPPPTLRERRRKRTAEDDDDTLPGDDTPVPSASSTPAPKRKASD